jgi:hypothetical protein
MITLVYDRLQTLNSDWLSWISRWINLELYDSNRTYDSSVVFYGKNPRFQKNIIDNLWESQTAETPGALTLQNNNWFWYYESLWYQHLGYNTYVPCRTYQHLAFMPMRLEKKHRTQLLKNMTPWLNDCIWSYVYQGKMLPNDGDAKNDWAVQRLFRPEWYDNTCFSIVAESTVITNKRQPVFATEKTYKPIAFQHPFMILGNVGTLTHLHLQGFETFENLWNESYDLETDWQLRINLICDNVAIYKKHPYDRITLEKIQHNRNRFFDQQLVSKRIFDEIIVPILEYAETS